jgi:hypothetical protein
MMLGTGPPAGNGISFVAVIIKGRPRYPRCPIVLQADLAGIGEKDSIVLDRHYCNRFSKVCRNANFMESLLGG